VHETPTKELPVVREPRPAPGGDAARSGETMNRFVALVDAVRSHEAATARRAVPRRPADHQLYRSLDEIQGLDAGPPLGDGPRDDAR
jgi:hypothetical protein